MPKKSTKYKISDKELKKQILDKYLTSGDFNGLPFYDYAKNFNTISEAKESIKKLIKSSDIELMYTAANPHIKPFDISKYQDEFLSELFKTPDHLERNIVTYEEIEVDFGNAYNQFCLYPTKKLLKSTLKNERRFLEKAPFTKLLCFGAPQLELVYFRIDVLDRYLEDPRYIVSYNDYYGRIYFNTKAKKHAEDMYLKYFGLAYNEKTGENLICAFIGDLNKLTDRHQYHFYSYMEQKKRAVFPEKNFYKNQILGEFAEEHSIFEAFLEEIKVINNMTRIICNEDLFRNEFGENDRKKLINFHPFLKPTKNTYSSFCQILDKLFTDNLNIDTIVKLDSVYGNKMDISYNKEGRIADGSLVLLKKFIKTYFKPANNEDVIEKVFPIWNNRETGIRTIRSKSSHNVSENVYDIKFFSKYRQTIQDAYKSIRFIRLIFNNDISVRQSIITGSLKIPDWLFEGKIRTYFIAPIKESNSK